MVTQQPPPTDHDSDFVRETLTGFSHLNVIVRNSDRFMNVTALCASADAHADKEVSWRRYRSTAQGQSWLNAVLNQLGETDIKEIVRSELARDTLNPVVWVHMRVAVGVMAWAAPSANNAILSIAHRTLCGETSTEESLAFKNSLLQQMNDVFHALSEVEEDQRQQVDQVVSAERVQTPTSEGLALARLLLVSDNKKDFVSESRIKEVIYAATGTSMERSRIFHLLKEMSKFAKVSRDKYASWTQRGSPGDRVGGWRFIRERCTRERSKPLQLPEHLLYPPPQARTPPAHSPTPPPPRSQPQQQAIVERQALSFAAFTRQNLNQHVQDLDLDSPSLLQPIPGLDTSLPSDEDFQRTGAYFFVKGCFYLQGVCSLVFKPGAAFWNDRGFASRFDDIRRKHPDSANVIFTAPMDATKARDSEIRMEAEFKAMSNAFQKGRSETWVVFVPAGCDPASYAREIGSSMYACLPPADPANANAVDGDQVPDSSKLQQLHRVLQDAFVKKQITSDQYIAAISATNASTA